MRTRDIRRKNTFKKQKQREHILKIHGWVDDTSYSSLVDTKVKKKLSTGLGRLSGELIQNCCGNSIRTKNSSRRGTPSSLDYGTRHNYKPRDLRQIERENDYKKGMRDVV